MKLSSTPSVSSPLWLSPVSPGPRQATEPEGAPVLVSGPHHPLPNASLQRGNPVEVPRTVPKPASMSLSRTLGISQIVSTPIARIGLIAKEPEDALKKRGGQLASLRLSDCPRNLAWASALPG